MAHARTPRSDWIYAALHALAEGGPDAIRVEALASRLGVSKGGFYWFFADRKALLQEMLDTWETAAVEEVIARVESNPADPRAKLEQLFEMASSPEGLAVELAVRDWARRNAGVAERLHGVDNRRMAYLRSLFGPLCADADDVEARSMLAYSLFIGSAFVTAEHDGRSRSQVLRLSLRRLLDESWG
ncbi:MAG: TetR/AcrR family transcriptional regulator [Nocardioides sp.]